MKALVTGGTGFAGGYLCDELARNGYTVTATTFDHETFSVPFENRREGVVKIDLTDADAVKALVAKHRPDFIFHLAAKTFVPDSIDNPADTLNNNVRCMTNLLEALRGLAWDPRLVFVSSSVVYGKLDRQPIAEDAPTNPDNPYAVSKRICELMALQYMHHYNLDVVIARPFSHTGIGQSTQFVVSAFASQVAAIDAGRRLPEMVVGNLTAVRDFTDVRDIATGYRLLAEKGRRGEIYHLSSGRGTAIKDVLGDLRGFCRKEVRVRGSKKLFRKTDVPVFIGDAAKAREELDWEPRHSLQDTLKDMFEHFRDSLAR